MDIQDGEDIILTKEEIEYINEQATLILKEEESNYEKQEISSNNCCNIWSTEIHGQRLVRINKEHVWVDCLFVCKIKENISRWLLNGHPQQSIVYVINVYMVPEEYIEDYLNEPEKTLIYRSTTLSEIDPHYSSRDGHLHFSYGSLDGAKRGVKRLISDVIYRPTARVKWKQGNNSQ